MKTVVFHWVWIGPSIPKEKLKELEDTIKLISKFKGTPYTGAIWWHKLGSEDKTKLQKPHTKYCSINSKEITGCMGEVKLDNGLMLPVFQVKDSEEMEKWRDMHEIPDLKDYIISRILLSNIVRLKVLGEYQGLYLDFDAKLETDQLEAFLKRIGKEDFPSITCHYKNKFPENDFIWVPPSGSEKIIELYTAITDGKKVPGQELKTYIGKPATYKDLEYNIKKFKDTCKFDKFEKELKSKPEKRYAAVFDNGSYKIYWTNLAKDFPECFDEEAVEKMVKVADSAQGLSDKTGFGNYQKFMKENNAYSTSDQISKLFTEESLVKNFYSWKDPGAQIIIDILKTEGPKFIKKM